MDVCCVRTVLGMGGVYAKVLLDMGGVLGPPLLFHSCIGQACHCCFTPTTVGLTIIDAIRKLRLKN
jgi:hypothetical protein